MWTCMKRMEESCFGGGGSIEHEYCVTVGENR